METGVQVEAKAVKETQTAKAMIAPEESAQKWVLEVLLLPGYGLSFPSASAAFASVHSLLLSGDVVNVQEDL